jgi:hypothetical protein
MKGQVLSVTVAYTMEQAAKLIPCCRRWLQDFLATNPTDSSGFIRLRVTAAFRRDQSDAALYVHAKSQRRTGTIRASRGFSLCGRPSPLAHQSRPRGLELSSHRVAAQLFSVVQAALTTDK